MNHEEQASQDKNGENYTPRESSSLLEEGWKLIASKTDNERLIYSTVLISLLELKTSSFPGSTG